jgi:hypothetical protein
MCCKKPITLTLVMIILGEAGKSLFEAQRFQMGAWVTGQKKSALPIFNIGAFLYKLRRF